MLKNLLKKIWWSRPVILMQGLLTWAAKTVGITLPEKWKYFLAIPATFRVQWPGNKGFRMYNSGYRLERSLFWQGLDGHEPQTIWLFRHLMPQCNWMVDVGANTGLFALVAQAVNPDARIWAFEPMPVFLKYLRMNIEANQGQIKSVDRAVSNIETVFDFYVPRKGQGNPYSSTINRDHFKGHQETEPDILKVQSVRLDAFLGEFALSDRGFIKIDAEGHDYEVLCGLGNLLVTLQPLLLVENRSSEVAEKMMQLQGMGAYQFLSIPDEAGKLPYWHDLPCNSAGRNMLFVPQKDREWVQSILGKMNG